MSEVGLLTGLLLAAHASAVSAQAAPPPLVCSGGEVPWRLELDPRRARLTTSMGP